MKEALILADGNESRFVLTRTTHLHERRGCGIVAASFCREDPLLHFKTIFPKTLVPHAVTSMQYPVSTEVF